MTKHSCKLRHRSAYRLIIIALVMMTIGLMQSGNAPLGVSVVYAQSATATLSGTVTDERGAVIPGATITVVNTNTKSQRQATTNDQGYFSIPLLPPSAYILRVEGQGFSPVEVNNIVLNVGDQRSLILELKVGTVSTGVTVTDNDSSVETSPSVGTVIDRQMVGNLPLNGRSFQSLISLTPGVTISIPTPTNTGQFSSNGQRTNSNYFSVDGVSANIGISSTDRFGEQSAGSVPALTSFGGTNNLISVDALQEFRIETSTFAPEFGRTPGAQVSLISRSGTREFHGSVFEYYRNDKLDANDYFANRAGLPRAELRQNQFGGVVGGPIILPRFGEGGRPWLNGRAHSFFFFSYEGLRLKQPQTAVTTVPSLRLRQLAPLNIQFLLNAFPIPTGPEIGTTGRSPFTGTYSDQSVLNATSFRIDHNFSDRVSLFGRFNYAPSTSLVRQKQTPDLINSSALKTETLTFGSTQALSSNAFNETRLNYSRSTGATSRALDNYGGAVPVTISQLLPDFTRGLSNISSTIQFFAGTFFIGTFNDNLQRQFNLVDILSYPWGSHNLKVGVDYRRLMPVFRARDYQASYNFRNEADVLAGRASIAQAAGYKNTRPVFNNFSAYFQDTWQQSHRLTLTYGTRWDVNPAPSEAGGLQPWALTSSNPSSAQIAPLGTPLWKTTWGNFAPRAGLSYQLSQKAGRELVLRGGIGLFYDLGNTQGGDAYTNGPFFTFSGTITNVIYPLPLDRAVLPPFPTTQSRGTTFGFDPNLKLPYTWQWNLTAQQSLGTNQMLSISYVAALGRRLLRPQLLFNPTPTFATLQYTDNGASSDYHSMQLQFTRRLSRNFQALASYTWSHSIDDISDETADLTSVRGNSDFDVRQNFSAALHYNSPWKPKGWTGWFLRDWQADLIGHAQSAYPLTPFVQDFAIISGAVVAQWPNVIDGVPLYVSDPTVAGGRRINRAAFRAPSPSTAQGNLGRNLLRGFPTFQIDFALQRSFSLSEQARLTFRAEAFNVFNHPNFGLPVANLSDPLFGQSTQMLGRNLGGLSPIYQIGGPRSIQLSIRLGF